MTGGHEYDDYLTDYDPPEGRHSSRGPGNAGEEGCVCGFTLSWPDGTSEDRAAMLRLWAEHESTCGTEVAGPDRARRRSTDAAYERETVVGASDGDELTRIITGQRTFIARLRKHPSYTLVRSWRDGSTEWAEFTIPASEWNPATGAKRRGRPMTDEQRQAAAERLRALHARKAGAG